MASLAWRSHGNGTYYVAARVSPRERSQRWEREAASVLGPGSGNCHRVTCAICSWSKQSQSSLPRGLEQMAEGMLCGRNDKDSAAVFALHGAWQRDRGRVVKGSGLLLDLMEWSAELPGRWSGTLCNQHLLIYSFDQSAESCCVFSLGLARCCTSETE